MLKMSIDDLKNSESKVFELLIFAPGTLKIMQIEVIKDAFISELVRQNILSVDVLYEFMSTLTINMLAIPKNHV